MFVELQTPARKWTLDNVEALTLPTCSGGIGILQGHIPIITALEIDTIILKQRGKDRNICSNVFVVAGKAIAEVSSNASGDTEVSIYSEKIFYINSEENNSNKLKEEKNSNEVKYGIEDISSLKEELETIENDIQKLEESSYLSSDSDMVDLKSRNINKSGSAYSSSSYSGASTESQYASTSAAVEERTHKQVIYEKKLNKLYQKGRIIRAILKGINLDHRN
jgi:F0F1-type ATP synthase epsilon subunit